MSLELVMAIAAVVVAVVGPVIGWRATSAALEAKVQDCTRRIESAESDIKQNSEHRAASEARGADMARRLEAIEEKLDRLLTEVGRV